MLRYAAGSATAIRSPAATIGDTAPADPLQALEDVAHALERQDLQEGKNEEGEPAWAEWVRHGKRSPDYAEDADEGAKRATSPRRRDVVALGRAAQRRQPNEEDPNPEGEPDGPHTAESQVGDLLEREPAFVPAEGEVVKNRRCTLPLVAKHAMAPVFRQPAWAVPQIREPQTPAREREPRDEQRSRSGVQSTLPLAISGRSRECASSERQPRQRRAGGRSGRRYRCAFAANPVHPVWISQLS